MPGTSRPTAPARRCGMQEVLGLVANKWTVLVIKALSRGPRRHGELQRAIDGVSQKMLTQTLRHLERDGLVARTVHPVVPPKVEYELTPLGATLSEPLGALCRWAERHLDELEAARSRHGGAPGDAGRRRGGRA